MAYVEVEYERGKERNHIAKTNADRNDEVLFKDLNPTKEKTRDEQSIKKILIEEFHHGNWYLCQSINRRASTRGLFHQGAGRKTKELCAYQGLVSL